jgi:ABC-2 type transport system permease protein
MTSLKEYADSRELVVNLTLRELRSRYKRSVLGWTWSLLNPLASVVIYTIVFSGFLKVQAPIGDPSGLDSFVMFLLCGLVPWNFVSGCLGTSLDALVTNGNLIKKVYFPRDLIIVSTVGSLLATFFIELGVVCAVLLVLGNMVLPWLPIALLLVVLLAVMLLGMGMALSVLNVYFRDVKHFMSIALQVLFYSCPIVYPPTLVPEHSDILGREIPVRFLYNLNPFARFIEAFRDVLYDLRFPSLATLAYVVVWTLGMLAFGALMFHRFEPRLAEEV